MRYDPDKKARALAHYKARIAEMTAAYRLAIRDAIAVNGRNFTSPSLGEAIGHAWRNWVTTAQAAGRDYDAALEAARVDFDPLAFPWVSVLEFGPGLTAVRLHGKTVATIVSHAHAHQFQIASGAGYTADGVVIGDWIEAARDVESTLRDMGYSPEEC